MISLVGILMVSFVVGTRFSTLVISLAGILTVSFVVGAGTLFPTTLVMSLAGILIVSFVVGAGTASRFLLSLAVVISISPRGRLAVAAQSLTAGSGSAMGPRRSMGSATLRTGFAVARSIRLRRVGVRRKLREVEMC